MTNTNRKYLFPVLFLIFLILVALGLRLWASNRMFLIEGPANMRMGPDGLVYIMTDSSLYIHDQAGNLIDLIPMTRFGIEKARGDFWVFNNGDLLLRRDTDKKLTCKRELETFFRTGSSKEDRIDTGDGILLRCSRATFECRPFGHGHDAFSKIGAFKVFVDEEKNDVYITDTTAHQLLLYDLNGELKRKSDPLFLYPNGIVRGNDGLLYVADTNHHRISAVNPDYDAFGRLEHSFSILNMLGPPKTVWPFALGQDKNNRWWVINAGDGMRNGDLMIYDGDGRVFRHVELPDDEDPTSIVVLADRVLVTDVSLMRVYSLGLNGEMQDDFGSLSLKIDSSDRLRERSLYSFLSSAMLYLILAAAITAMVLAWKSQAASKFSGQREVDFVNQNVEEKGDRSSDSAPIGDLTRDSGNVSGAKMPASQGWLWLSDALRIVKSSSRIYVVLFLITLLRWQGSVRIPQIGYLLLLLLSPLIMGILMLLSRMVVDHNRIEVRNMRLRPHIVDLLFTGAVYCIVIGGTVVVAQLITGRSMVPAMLLGRTQDFRKMLIPGIDPPFLIGIVVLLILSIAMFAASWFTPPLIVFKRLSFMQAMIKSFRAVIRNYGAFTLYGIILIGFFVISFIAMFLIPALIFIPLGLETFVAPLGMIIAFLFWPAVAPIITLSVYTSYVRIFEKPPNA